MAAVANHDELIPFTGKLGNLDMHLGHQGTGGIEYAESPAIGLFAQRLAHAMRAEHQRSPGRHLIERLDKNGPTGTQIAHHMGVVHDLVAHIDGAAELGQRMLDDVDRPIDARAKAAWRRQHDFAFFGSRC